MTVYFMARGQASGSRHPLDPVLILLRRTQISHSASLAVGIVVPWRSNRRYVLLNSFVWICSIASLFLSGLRGPFLLFAAPNIALVGLDVIQLVV